jgi:hypothetical protein
MSELLPPTRCKQPGWPSFWGPDALREQHALIQSRAFERGFRQKPQSDEDLIFPHLQEGSIFQYDVNWQNISDPDHPDFNEDHDFYVSPDYPRYIGCDLSGKNRRGTCIFTLAISPSGVRHVLDIRLGSWGAGPDFIQQLQTVNKNILLRPRRIFVENNAIQEAVVQTIQAMGGEFGGKVFPFRTGHNKMDPEIGLPGIDAQYAEKRWKIGIPHRRNKPSFPDKKNPTICLCGICMLVRAAQTFTADDLKETPDTIAAQFIAKEASRQGERYSDTSSNVVKVSQADIQREISSAMITARMQALRIPVATHGRRPYGSRQVGTSDFGRISR